MKKFRTKLKELRSNTRSFLLLLLLSGCSISPIYHPEEAQTPLFTNSNQLDASISKNGAERGYSVNAAYSINNVYFLAGKYSISRLSNCRTCTINVRDYGELSIGKFNFHSTLKLTEALVGIGKGHSKSSEGLLFSNKDTPLVKSNFSRAFIQANWAKKTAKNNKIFSLRATYLYLNSFVELDDNDLDVTSNGRDWSLYIEPAGTVKYWVGNFYAKGQLGLSVPMLFDNKFQHDWVWLVATAGYRFDI